ncbi:MAG: RNA polymerase subunit sigma, partial [Lachnospiraceae bacterium]
MIDDEKIIDLFFKRDQQGIREMDNKYGAVCHNLSYNIVKIVRNISLKIYWRKEAAKRSGHYKI